MYFNCPGQGWTSAWVTYPSFQGKVDGRMAYPACPKGYKAAYAMLIAGPDYPSITGMITFADTPAGTMVCADVRGLPEYRPAEDGKSPVGPFGFHIHEGGHCDIGDPENRLKAAEDTGTRRTSPMAIMRETFRYWWQATAGHGCAL